MYFGWFQDLNNFESDPEEFAKTLCADLGVHDPEVGVSPCILYHFFSNKGNIFH